MTGLILLNVNGDRFGAKMLLCFDLYWNYFTGMLYYKIHFRTAFFRSPIMNLHIVKTTHLLHRKLLRQRTFIL